MPVRDEGELTGRLDRDMAWRTRELSSLSLVLQRAEALVQVGLMRGLICLLYAHWEGFVRNAARSYLEYIANRRLKYRELRRNFLVIGLRPYITGVASGGRSISADTKLVRAVFDAGEERTSKSIVQVIETKPNLDSRVLREILSAVGFETREYLSKGPLLDKRLVGNRNKIAHGEQLEIQMSDYLDLHAAVIELMNRFKEDIETAVVTRNYRAATDT